LGSDADVETIIRALIEHDETAVAAFEAKKSELGEGFTLKLRHLLLQIVDMFWLEHLETMDYLRRSVSLRAYGQRDPLIEYRREGLQRFRQLEMNITSAFIESLPRLVGADDAQLRAEQEKTRAMLVAAGKEEGSTQMPVVGGATYGRNDFITIKKGDATQTIKFKKAESLLADGWEIIGNK
jgi:preprotein translocase subunit SecA